MPDAPQIGLQKIFWTGGWDSTFQLVRSLLDTSTPIQPFYLIDENRASTAMELVAMKRIKEKFRADFPRQADLLLPVIFAARSDLPAHEASARALAEIGKSNRIGIQYDWLARLCQRLDISDLELCIHQDDSAHRILQGIVREDTLQGGYRIDASCAGTPEYELFRYYRFPIFDMTKLQMQAVAAARGFSAIMGLTWFCHSPKNQKPCGSCVPCQFTIDEGLGWRIPHIRRLKGKVVLNARKLARARAAMSAPARAH